MEILDEILQNADEEYRKFHSRLVPTIDNVLGLRGPRAREIAKKYADTDIGNRFLDSLPHKYYDENLVHAYMLCFIKKDLEKKLKDFIPYIDNWAVCDSLVCGLKRFFRDTDEKYDLVTKCLNSDRTYVARFGLVSLLSYYVNDKYIDKVLCHSVKIKSQEYYINMANAWLISVCLVKQYERTIKVIEEKSLDKWTHNKAIQKAIESLRITKEQKEYLRKLKIK